METTHNQFSFLSNVLKLEQVTEVNNRSVGEYMYMTFAESPIVSREEVPNELQDDKYK